MRIVLVDDEENIRKGIKCMLEQLDMDIKVVGEAKNGLEGLEIIELLQPDVTLIDIRMPIMDGLELSRTIYEKQICPDMKYVILTAYSEFEYAQKAIRYGVSDYLLKPLDENILYNLFQRLNNHSASYADVSTNLGIQMIRKYINKHEITNPIITEMLLYIGKNYMKNIQLSDLAKKFYVTPSYVSSLFKRTTNENFIEFLNLFRIEIAKKLMSENIGKYKIWEISHMVGFNNVTYFNRVFRTITGVTPMEFIRKYDYIKKG